MPSLLRIDPNLRFREERFFTFFGPKSFFLKLGRYDGEDWGFSLVPSQYERQQEEMKTVPVCLGFDEGKGDFIWWFCGRFARAKERLDVDVVRGWWIDRAEKEAQQIEKLRRKGQNAG